MCARSGYQIFYIGSTERNILDRTTVKITTTNESDQFFPRFEKIRERKRSETNNTPRRDFLFQSDQESLVKIDEKILFVRVIEATFSNNYSANNLILKCYRGDVYAVS